MPFGLGNSAATFTRMMRRLFESLNDVNSCIADLLVHTSTWEEHIKALKLLLQRLRAINMQRCKCYCRATLKSLTTPSEADGSFQQKGDYWGVFCPILIKSIYVMYSNVFLSQYII